MMGVIFSVCRLLVAVAGLAMLSDGVVSARGDAVPACFTTSSPFWACLRDGGFFADGKYCHPGSSSECETCYFTANPNDMCFFGDFGPEEDGWIARQYEE